MDKLEAKLQDYLNNKPKGFNLKSIKGTVGYMAPELILLNYCSKAADIFASGVGKRN
jgi:serine/threonine protein kinase